VQYEIEVGPRETVNDLHDTLEVFVHDAYEWLGHGWARLRLRPFRRVEDDIAPRVLMSQDEVLPAHAVEVRRLVLAGAGLAQLVQDAAPGRH
jgi:hypothetical protein